MSETNHQRFISVVGMVDACLFVQMLVGRWLKSQGAGNSSSS